VTLLVCASDHTAQAIPASEGDQESHEQHEAKADTQFAIDAYVSQFLG
jgi:hypothetical protein